MDLKFLKKAAHNDAFVFVGVLTFLVVGAVIVYYPATLLVALIVSACYGCYEAGKSSH